MTEPSRTASPVVRYSVVSAFLNESGNLRPLYERLKAVLDQLAEGDWELILVDDGSSDDSWTVVKQLAQDDPRVVGLRFSRNFGHNIALAAGLDFSRGSRVVTMDSDLQDLPEELPKLARKMDEGYDVVHADRQDRRHPLTKRLGSRAFLWLLNSTSSVPERITGSVFRIMSRQVVDEVCRLRERHRYFTGLTAWVGFRQTPVAVIHGARVTGVTKYDMRRMLALAVDSLTAFSARPLAYATYAGAAIAVIGALLWVRHLFRQFAAQAAAVPDDSVLAAVLVLGGANLFTLGVIGHYLARMFEEGKGRPMYILDEIVRGKIVRRGGQEIPAVSEEGISRSG